MTTINFFAPLADLPSTAKVKKKRIKRPAIPLGPIDIIENPTTIGRNRLEEVVMTAQESVQRLEADKLSYPNTHGLFFPQKATDRVLYIAQPIVKALVKVDFFSAAVMAIPALASSDARGPLAALPASTQNGILIGATVVAGSLASISMTLLGSNRVHGWFAAKNHRLEQSVLEKVDTAGFKTPPETDEEKSVLAAFKAQQECYASCLAISASLTVGLSMINDQETFRYGLVGVAALLAHSGLAYGYDLHTAKSWEGSQAHAASLRHLTSNDVDLRQDAKSYLSDVAHAFVGNHPYRYAIAVISLGAATTAAVFGTIRPAESTIDEHFAHLKQNVLPAFPLFAVGINNLLIMANQSRTLAGKTVSVADIGRSITIENARRELQRARNELIRFNELVRFNEFFDVSEA